MNAVDLFAGCGGLSLGFQKQGFNIVAAFEWWDAAVNCYRANFSHPVFQTDLSNVAIISAYASVSTARPASILFPACEKSWQGGPPIIISG